MANIVFQIARFLSTYHQNLAEYVFFMLGKSPQPQTNLFLPHLSSFIDMNHELVLLAHQID